MKDSRYFGRCQVLARYLLRVRLLAFSQTNMTIESNASHILENLMELILIIVVAITISLFQILANRQQFLAASGAGFGVCHLQVFQRI